MVLASAQRPAAQTPEASSAQQDRPAIACWVLSSGFRGAGRSEIIRPETPLRWHVPGRWAGSSDWGPPNRRPSYWSEERARGFCCYGCWTTSLGGLSIVGWRSVQVSARHLSPSARRFLFAIKGSSNNKSLLSAFRGRADRYRGPYGLMLSACPGGASSEGLETAVAITNGHMGHRFRSNFQV